MTFPSLFQAPQAAGILLTASSTGRSLYLRRRDCRCWGTPGGRIERGEDTFAAMMRELREETGGVLKSYTVCEKTIRDGNYELFFGVVTREFRPVLNDEHSEHVWACDPPEPLHPALRRQLGL